MATAVNGVLALGVTFVIITGGIDLSIGTILTFSTVMIGRSSRTWGCRSRWGCCSAWPRAQPAAWSTAS